MNKLMVVPCLKSLAPARFLAKAHSRLDSDIDYIIHVLGRSQNDHIDHGNDF